MVKKPQIPVETFTIKKGKRHRFRLISAAMSFYLCVSIDGHVLNVIASDSSRVVTKQVDFIVIGSGERYDFWIEANQTVNNFWIRAETLEASQNGHVCKFKRSEVFACKFLIVTDIHHQHSP